MNQLERAAQAAVEAASAEAPQVVEVEARAGRLRRGRVLRVGAAAVVVALAVVAGSVAVLARGDDRRTVDTAGEDVGEPVRLSVVFPEDASEERERAVLEARLAELGAPSTVAGEWPSLTVTVEGFTEDEVAWVVGAPGELTAAVATGPAPLVCAGEDVARLHDEIDELQATVDELATHVAWIEQQIADAGDSVTPELDNLMLERATLLGDMTAFKAEIRDLLREAAVSGGAADGGGWPPEGSSCTGAIDAAELDGTIATIRVVPEPGDRPEVTIDDVPVPVVDGTPRPDVMEGRPTEIITIDFAGTELGDAIEREESAVSLFLDGWPWGGTRSMPAGVPSTTFGAEIDLRDATLVAAVIVGGGYDAPPDVAPATG